MSVFFIIYIWSDLFYFERNSLDEYFCLKIQFFFWLTEKNPFIGKGFLSICKFVPWEHLLLFLRSCCLSTLVIIFKLPTNRFKTMSGQEMRSNKGLGETERGTSERKWRPKGKPFLREVISCQHNSRGHFSKRWSKSDPLFPWHFQC